jgi:hypothetical protein
MRAGRAQHLASKGAVDAQRLCIDGGSAGGYTTLACLAFRRGRMRRRACVGSQYARAGQPRGIAQRPLLVTQRWTGCVPTHRRPCACRACVCAWHAVTCPRATGGLAAWNAAALMRRDPVFWKARLPTRLACAGMCSPQERVTTAWPTASCSRRYGLLPCLTL